MVEEDGQIAYLQIDNPEEFWKISKSMLNAITYSTFNIVDIDEDFKKADEIIEYDYSRNNFV